MPTSEENQAAKQAAGQLARYTGRLVVAGARATGRGLSAVVRAIRRRPADQSQRLTAAQAAFAMPVGADVDFEETNGGGFLDAASRRPAVAVDHGPAYHDLDRDTEKRQEEQLAAVAPRGKPKPRTGLTCGLFTTATQQKYPGESRAARDPRGRSAQLLRQSHPAGDRMDFGVAAGVISIFIQKYLLEPHQKPLLRMQLRGDEEINQLPINRFNAALRGFLYQDINCEFREALEKLPETTSHQPELAADMLYKMFDRSAVAALQQKLRHCSSYNNMHEAIRSINPDAEEPAERNLVSAIRLLPVAAAAETQAAEAVKEEEPFNHELLPPSSANGHAAPAWLRVDGDPEPEETEPLTRRSNGHAAASASLRAGEDPEPEKPSGAEPPKAPPIEVMFDVGDGLDPTVRGAAMTSVFDELLEIFPKESAAAHSDKEEGAQPTAVATGQATLASLLDKNVEDLRQQKSEEEKEERATRGVGAVHWC